MDKRKVVVVSSIVNDGVPTIDGVYGNINAAKDHVLHLYEVFGYITHPIEKEGELSKILFSRGGDISQMYFAQFGSNKLTVTVTVMEVESVFPE